MRIAIACWNCYEPVVIWNAAVFEIIERNAKNLVYNPGYNVWDIFHNHALQL
jgi:hypothetical protein